MYTVHLIKFNTVNNCCTIVQNFRYKRNALILYNTKQVDTEKTEKITNISQYSKITTCIGKNQSTKSLKCNSPSVNHSTEAWLVLLLRPLSTPCVLVSTEPQCAVSTGQMVAKQVTWINHGTTATTSSMYLHEWTTGIRDRLYSSGKDNTVTRRIADMFCAHKNKIAIQQLFME